ncbi:lytic polysaccharide monooxygenase [Lentithecium fluviatile CBS 122367]|uniref:AA9 family lytic polysaccharide monooxygenase n=1 Tax=Lentithecium fluviatile CBS 122367 TaxID=1168545 RepID=A0A6G1JEB0_9PLEO|nr:lytic polysaccharide monooxygenase [Lentithecium fluviatile CBS 122367]
MSFSKIQAATLLGALASSVSAHGLLASIAVDGTTYKAYDPSFQYSSTPSDVVEWECPECQDNGFVDPTMYTDVTKIACHKDATAGPSVAKVAAGGTVDIKWTTWPDSHKGPVIDYLAKVDDATKATSAELQFFKIDEAGYDGTQWAAEKLIANDLTWSVKIPSNIAAGQYVLRHEIIALHSAGQANGAQNYPKCVNIEVTGGGSETPTGITADQFYTPTDPGILVNIYGTISSYEIPGPALFDGASSGSDTSAIASSTAAASTTAVPTSAATVETSTVETSAVETSAAPTTAAPTTVATSAVSGSTTTVDETVVVTATIAPSSAASLEENVQSTIAVATPTATATAVPTSVIDPLVSGIGAISTAIPTSFLTQPLPTAVPTGATGNASGPLPSKPLPAGVTLKDLLEWLSYYLKNIRKGGRATAARKHPRAF